VPVTIVGSVRVKGVNFKTLLSTLARIHGQQSVDATLSLLPPEIEEALRLGAVVASGWYPIDWYRALHVAIHTACSGGLELSRQLGRESSIDDFRGIYRYLLKVISSEVLVAQAPRVFQMYFKGGEVMMTDSSRCAGVLDFRGWHGFDKAIWADVTGGVEGILVARGAAAVRQRVLRGGSEDHLTVEYRWG
jgi:hypothetical protein